MQPNGNPVGEDALKLRSACPTGFEEFREHLRTLVREHSALNFGTVVETRVPEQIAD